jgi:hypothetical protein
VNAAEAAVNAKILVAVAALALSSAAEAKSPRWGSFELGAGPYWTDLDAEFEDGSSPFQDAFGKKPGWGFRTSLGYAVLDTDFGALEVGARTGFMRKGGHGISVTTGLPTRESTSLLVWPAAATLTLRVDWLAVDLIWLRLYFFERC